MARDSYALSWGKARQTERSRAALMLEKAVVIGEDQVRTSAPFLPPLRTAVSGSRMLAAAGTNRL